MKDLIDKIKNKPDYDIRMKLIYMWVKQEHITYGEFLHLVKIIHELEK